MLSLLLLQPHKELEPRPGIEQECAELPAGLAPVAAAVRQGGFTGPSRMLRAAQASGQSARGGFTGPSRVLRAEQASRQSAEEVSGLRVCPFGMGVVGSHSVVDASKVILLELLGQCTTAMVHTGALSCPIPTSRALCD